MENEEITEFEMGLTTMELTKFRPYMISYHFRISQINQLREQIRKLGAEPCQ